MSQEAFLVTVKDNIEADIIKSLLDSYQIPVLEKYKEGGDYMHVFMGTTQLGIDIYVPSELLDKAKDILQNHFDESDFAQNEISSDTNDNPVIEENYECTRKNAARWIIFLVFLIPALIALLIIFARMKNIFFFCLHLYASLNNRIVL
jgi:hypothetical protein